MQAKPIFDLYARFLRMAWHGKAKSSIHAKEKAWLTNQRYAFYMPNPLGVRQVSSMAWVTCFAYLCVARFVWHGKAYNSSIYKACKQVINKQPLAFNT